MVPRLLMPLMLTAKALATPVAFGVVGAVLDAQGQVLLVRQSYMAGWMLPGGGVGRGEVPAAALLRELGEEVGLTGGTPDLFGVYSRRAGWVTNVMALYLVRGATIAFRPNWEVRAVQFADMAAPPPGTSPATLRRLSEIRGVRPRSEIW